MHYEKPLWALAILAFLVGLWGCLSGSAAT